MERRNAVKGYAEELMRGIKDQISAYSGSFTTQGITMIANGASKCSEALCEAVMRGIKGEITAHSGSFDSQHIAMIANGASKCEGSIKDSIKESLQAKICLGDACNVLFEAGVLLGVLEDGFFKEKYRQPFNKEGCIDLHGLNSDGLTAVLNWMRINGDDCFCKGRVFIFEEPLIPLAIKIK